MRDILTANQAAKVIGCDSQKIRIRLERNIWKFGRVISVKETGNKQKAYEINKRDLAGFLKIDLDEVERRLSE